MGDMLIEPIYLRLEQLRPVIAAHRHSHTSYEIHYAAQGTGRLYTDTGMYPIRKDTLFITGPDISHEQHSDTEDPILEYCLYLNCKRVGKKKETSSLTHTFLDTKFWIGTDSEHVFEAMNELADEKRNHSLGRQEMAEAILRRIIILLARTYQEKSLKETDEMQVRVLSDAKPYPLVEDAFFYNHKTLCLSDLAEILHLSERQTQRFLQEHYGMTFTQKLTEARMSKAIYQLTNTNDTIEKISAIPLENILRQHFGVSITRHLACIAKIIELHLPSILLFKTPSSKHCFLY